MLRTLFAGLLAMYALAQAPLERALTLAREKRYAEARKALDGIAEPGDAGPRIAFHRLKAAIGSGLGEAGVAADEMRAALALAPADGSLLLATAAAELQAGRLEDALTHARAGGGGAVGQALTGDIQEKRGNYVEAAKAYQSAVKLAPDREQYRIALALELVEHHTFEPAISVLEQAAPLFPKSARIRTLLGVAHYAARHYADAEAALTEAITVEPGLEPAYRYLAQVALESSAAPGKKTLAAICGWNEIVCNALKARVAQENGDAGLKAEAIAGMKRAPEDNSIARCELARAYQSAAQWQEARAEQEACVRLEPSPQNHYRLGVIYGKLGLADLARQQMALRNAEAERLSEDIARRERTVQAFRLFK